MAAQQTKMLGTGRWLKWPARQSTTETTTGVYDEARKLGQVEWDDRIVLFNGKWFCPPVTVKPRFEAWDYEKLQSTEPELVVDPDAATFLPKTKNLILIGLGVLGVLGTIYFLRWKQRKSFESKVANAAAQSVQDSISEAFPGGLNQAVQGAAAEAFGCDVVQQAISRALQKAAEGAIAQNAAPPQANLDLQDALVQALKDAAVKEAIGLAVSEAIASVQTSNVTAEATGGHLDASDEQETNLGTFLNTLGDVVSEPTLQSGIVKVEDLVTSSVEQLVGCGINEEDAVKMKKAVSYLLDHSLL